MPRKVIEIFNDSTTRSLTRDQSGTVVFIDTSSSDVTVNLPPIEAGLHYEFIISHTSTNANSFILKSVNTSYVHSELMYVGQLSNTVGKTITLDSSVQSNLSERVQIHCNGTNWFITITSSNLVNYSLTT